MYSHHETIHSLRRALATVIHTTPVPRPWYFVESGTDGHEPIKYFLRLIYFDYPLTRVFKG